jgi:uncharacterized protein
LSLFTQSALFSIRIYQRYLSPYKGFCCAYRTHTGRESCSQLGFRVIRRFGVANGLNVLNQRLYLCGVASRRYRVADQITYRRRPRSQRGDCDPGCVGGCDVPDFNASSCEALQCLDCGDWSRKKKKDQKGEASVYIPPYSR